MGYLCVFGGFRGVFEAGVDSRVRGVERGARGGKERAEKREGENLKQ